MKPLFTAEDFGYVDGNRDHDTVECIDAAKLANAKLDKELLCDEFGNEYIIVCALKDRVQELRECLLLSQHWICGDECADKGKHAYACERIEAVLGKTR